MDDAFEAFADQRLSDDVGQRLVVVRRDQRTLLEHFEAVGPEPDLFEELDHMVARKLDAFFDPDRIAAAGEQLLASLEYAARDDRRSRGAVATIFVRVVCRLPQDGTADLFKRSLA